MRRKKLKLQNLDVELRSQSNDKPPIFKGVVAHVNGYTQPSLSDLHRLIVTHGGGFLQYLDGKTVASHVVASNLTPKKKVEFANYRIVKPAWVVDSVKAAKLLPWDGYRLVDEGVAQKTLGFDSGRFVSQSSTQRSTYRDQTETSWYNDQIRQNSSNIFSSGNSKTPQPPELRSPGHFNDISPPPHNRAEVLTNNNLADQVDSATQEPSPTPSSEANRKNEDTSHGSLPQLEKKDDEDDDPEDLSGFFPVKNEPADSALWPNYEGDVPSAQRSPPHIKARDAVQIFEDEKTWNEHSPPVTKQYLAQTDESPKVSEKLTAEEHNARLLSDPHMAKSSAVNPEFLNQYYRESRLHHLSTWKAELKAQLQALADEQTSSQQARQKRPPGARRYVMHVDFDSFFAAVSLRKHPQLVDKPVVIAHGSGPGSEIASCNYPARNFGVKNGMWMKTALKLCDQLQVLPYDYKAYEEASRHFYDSIIGTDGLVQSVSIDEALVDISNQCVAAGGTDGKAMYESAIYREQEKADQIGSDLRALVLEKTGCHVSVGIGTNILLAKLALRKAKPAGQYQVKPDNMLEFIGEYPVQDLPGVAYSLGSKLEELGVKYIKDIRSLNRERLSSALGPKTGQKLWEYARGIDKTEVGEQVKRKSVSAEVNWGIRFVTQQQADEFVQNLCDELSRRLLEQGFKGSQMTMKIMRRAADAPLDPPKNLGHGKCDTFNKSIVLGVATNDRSVLGREALSILKAFGFSPGELRGLGVQMQKLEPIKPSKTTSSLLESSQRRLQFRRPSSVPSQLASVTPSAMVTGSSERASSHSVRKTRRIQDQPDPIERSPTPEAQAAPLPPPAIKGAIPPAHADGDDVPHKPLNITGTQFVLPSQIDPDVLAELPTDVRSKLAPRQQDIAASLTKAAPAAPTSSEYGAQSSAASMPGLPTQSQLDPDTLQALPEDVRNELLSFYREEAAKSKLVGGHPGGQLPQATHTSKSTSPSKRVTATPTKKQKHSLAPRRGRPPKNRAKSGSTSSLMQSNFISHAVRATNGNVREARLSSAAGDSPDVFSHGDQQHERSTDPAPPGISDSFLAALPDDMRAEVLADQKRQRLRERSGLNIDARKKKLHIEAFREAGGVGGGGHSTTTGEFQAPQGKARYIQLPEKNAIPTFTSKKLHRVEDLKKAVGAWVDEFSSSGPPHAHILDDEGGTTEAGETDTIGPYAEDVEALASYLGLVVLNERDMDKAVAVLRWMEWKIGEIPETAETSEMSADDDGVNQRGRKADHSTGISTSISTSQPSPPPPPPASSSSCGRKRNDVVVVVKSAWLRVLQQLKSAVSTAAHQRGDIQGELEI